MADAWRHVDIADHGQRPVVNRPRRYRSPRLLMLPSFSLPPLEFCLGTRPTQAEKSRPDRDHRRWRRERWPNTDSPPATRSGRCWFRRTGRTATGLRFPHLPLLGLIIVLQRRRQAPSRSAIAVESNLATKQRTHSLGVKDPYEARLPCASLMRDGT